MVKCVELNPRPNPSIGENPENVLYEAWKNAPDPQTRQSVEQDLLPLLRTHASKVCWMVLHSNQPHLVNEIVDDTIMDLAKFQGNSQFSTWFHARATYRCRTEWRVWTRRKECTNGGEVAGIVVDPTLRLELRQLIEQLSPRDRSIVDLKLEGYSNAQVAKRLDYTCNRIDQLWRELRSTLKEMYGRKASK